MSNKGTIYIAGPMTGINEYNFAAFDMAEADLRAKGWEVINPAQMDRDIGFDPSIDIADKEFLHHAMIRDTDAIIHDADALALLPGWEKSKGARGELGLAFWKHIPAYQWPAMTEIAPDAVAVMREKQPIICHEKPADSDGVQPVTGNKVRAEYPIASGVLDYFPDAIREVARCSWIGSQQHNPGAPMKWDQTKSKDHPNSLMRHFLERGQVDTDGIRHSVKVAWRALALLQKEIENA